MSDPFAPLDGGGAARVDKAPQFRAVLPVPGDAPAPPAAHPTLGAPSARWTYRDGAGAILGLVYRFDRKDQKQFRPLVFFEPAAGGAGVWRWEAWPAPRPLYGLDRLAARPQAPVVLCEGEKAADAASTLLSGHVCVASPNGSKSAAKADWSALAGRQVIIWPDADAPGAAYAREAGKLALEAGAAAVSIAILPEVAEGWDAADALAAGWSPEMALDLLAGAAPIADKAAASSSLPSGKKPKKTPRRPQRDFAHGVDGRLPALARAGLRGFRDRARE